MAHKYSSHLELQIVDRREEIAAFERQFRPFPPRSGSVSKPKPSLEALPAWADCRFMFADPGAGKTVYYVGVDMAYGGDYTVVYDHGDPWELPG